MPSSAGHRAWITAVPAGSPPASYSEWVYVDDGAATAALKAPEGAGSYELRLHTDYPAKPTNVVASMPFSVAAAPTTQIAGNTGGAAPTPRAQQTFTATKTTAKAGEKLAVRFAAPLYALPNEKFWITIVARDAAEGSYDAWFYLTPGQRIATLTAPAKAGDYEIRLHANYPTKSYNIVHRVPLHVTN